MGVRGFPTISFFQDLHPPVWRIFYTIFSSIVFTLLAVTFQLIKLHSNAHDGSSLLKTHTANEGNLRIQYKCLVPLSVSSEMKLCSLVISKKNYNVLSPNFDIQISVRYLCISKISLSILLQPNTWTDSGNI
jgi:hypothetical protein